ncbi:MarR family transcriptional regulator [Pseudofrankia sp. DC12]|uniref:MarR family winged helix-turn-helix transcriptional regulator n=1 Tax=Pseudofrankia sp. DC12 TaxID=683315 RepID=UPI0005F8592B|nr:MarR family transcriptional regulator [Pseudofrankia sp. DC12]
MERQSREADIDLEALLQELVSAAQLFQSAAGLRARLTSTELAVLAIVRSNPRVAGQLALATQLTTGAITRVLDGLERRGYVTRLPDPGDRRRVVVTAVAERLAALDVMFGPMTEAASAIQAKFSPAEQATIARFLVATTGMLRDQTASLRDDPAASATPVTLGAPLGSATQARLHLAGGLKQLQIVSGGPDFPADSLYQGDFAGAAPTSEVIVRPDETEVRVQFGRRNRSLWRAGSGASTLTLSPLVAWAIDVRGGAQQLVVELQGVAPRSFSLTGGANDLRLRLGAPGRGARISLTGGAKALRLERPADVPVNLRIRGGASDVVVDGQRQGPFGSWTYTMGQGTTGYELAITGGVSRLEVAALA